MFARQAFAVASGAACIAGSAVAMCDTGVTTFASGLQIEDLACGRGDVAVQGKILRVHYEGRLESFDGRIFDSSYQRKKPLEFELGARKVILGWEEGVSGMKVGGRRRLVVPAELAYGTKGIKDPVKNGHIIPPNATLYFEVELVSAEFRAPGIFETLKRMLS